MRLQHFEPELEPPDPPDEGMSTNIFFIDPPDPPELQPHELPPELLLELPLEHMLEPPDEHPQPIKCQSFPHNIKLR